MVAHDVAARLTGARYSPGLDCWTCGLLDSRPFNKKTCKTHITKHDKQKKTVRVMAWTVVLLGKSWTMVRNFGS